MIALPNSIRTPRVGTSVTSRRIAQAVDDEDWQKFRLSMKGKSTEQKLEMLEQYYTDAEATVFARTLLGISASRRHADDPNDPRCMHSGVDMDCDVCVRLDNYIKALCRGGQLYPGESLETVLNQDWKPRIKR